jgi:SagB-type dehydrogenase family enzyme
MAVSKGWQPLAAAFHYGTRDVRWRRGAEREAFEDALARKAGSEPPPPHSKPVRGAGIHLPAGTYAGEFPGVLLARRTWRGFGRKPLSQKQLGALLDLTFGAQMTGIAQSGGEVLFKTSPSGGARHPVEAYVMALRVTGVAPGLYHYAPTTSRLHLVRSGSSPARAVEYLAGQSWYEGAAAIVFMTAVMPRLWWRYQHPRVYRAALFEAGHLCQTFCLTATWLGLAPFCTMALEDSRVEKALRIDGIEEVLLYAAGVGSRPADGRWVQWPGNRPDVLKPPPGRRKTPRAR